ncbi:MAG: SCP2 sterol-binding domain-containing protein, partial [Chloroflexota bacterium]
MSVVEDLQGILGKMPAAFVPEKAANLNAVVQLDLTGDGGGQWAVKITDGAIALEPGLADTADLTLTMAASDYVALSLGEASPMNLFMAGKIKVQGDVMLA